MNAVIRFVAVQYWAALVDFRLVENFIAEIEAWEWRADMIHIYMTAGLQIPICTVEWVAISTFSQWDLAPLSYLEDW